MNRHILITAFTHFAVFALRGNKAFSVSRDNMAADEAYVFSVIYAMREKERKTSVVQAAAQRSRFTLLACEQTPRVEGGGGRSVHRLAHSLLSRAMIRIWPVNAQFQMGLMTN